MIAQAALVDLYVYVSLSIYEQDGTTPLADGSVVYIVGSKDSVNDGMAPYGNGYVADSALGDDVIIGVVRIDSGSGGAGTFDAYFVDAFDTDDVQFIYLRFFDEQGELPLMGLLDYGESGLFNYTTNFGMAEVGYFGDPLKTDKQDEFYAIPEPHTAHLLLLAIGGLVGIHSLRRSRSRGLAKVLEL